MALYKVEALVVIESVMDAIEFKLLVISVNEVMYIPRLTPMRLTTLTLWKPIIEMLEVESYTSDEAF